MPCDLQLLTPREIHCHTHSARRRNSQPLALILLLMNRLLSHLRARIRRHLEALTDEQLQRCYSFGLIPCCVEFLQSFLLRGAVHCKRWTTMCWAIVCI